MKKIINSEMGLLAVGVLQPTSASEVRGFLHHSFPDAGELPPVADFAEFLLERSRLGHIAQVSSRHGGLYSLTFAGHSYLSQRARKLRDKLRMYLLRDAYRARIIMSRGESGEELAGDSPALDKSTDTKGSAANKVFGLRALGQKPYWPRISGQFRSKTGLSRPPRDDFFPSLLSFDSTEQVAASVGPHSQPFELDYVGLAVCLGVSPKLISQIANRPARHYRHFPLPKASGGVRDIESPRVFLKVIQWFLADHVFVRLPVHPAVHSFRLGRSVVSNATPHVGKRYVGSMDIENFFGSISRTQVREHLTNCGFKGWESDLISKLCTNQDHLPQGAPTSPVISNSLLFDFDHHTQRYCNEQNLEYTRYADDITISGQSRAKISEAFKVVELRLRESYRLRVRSDKTRIASRHGQQQVTGVVVNSDAAPPRMLRRRVRAMFHQASLRLSVGTEQLAQLRGYIGYLGNFPKLKNSSELQEYTSILKELQARALPSQLS